uniref:ATP-dependent RNA helicase n=1 Tax=Meloidogyne javanica TaxID=6303 RepID=A0A915MUA0_MELJA
MRVHVTLFLLTILLEFVFGMWKEGPSTSYSQNVMEQGVQRAMNVQGRGGRLPIEILFEQVDRSLKLEKGEAVKHAALLKKFLVSLGTWENEGISNEAFESAVYTKRCLPVDDDYFKLDSSISMDIERLFVEYDHYGNVIDKQFGKIEFNDLNFHNVLLDNIYRLCMFEKPTPVQAYAIRILTFPEKIDLIAVAETGSGKTAAFLIPLIYRLLEAKKKGEIKNKNQTLTYFPIALILLPTQELAQQTYLEVLKLAYRTPLVPALIHGGQDNYAPQVDTFKLGCDILVATPLRLIEMTKNSDIGLSNCSFLVMDESDRLLDSDFAKQTGAIIQQLPAKEERTTGRVLLKF